MDIEKFAIDYPNTKCDGNDVVIVYENDCYMELCFAKAHVALKEWLLEFNGGYEMDENVTSKSVFVIDTPKDCLHCPMRTCLHINDKHYQLCGLQIPHYGYGTEAFFKDEDLKENWTSPKCPLISDKEFIRNSEI